MSTSAKLASKSSRDWSTRESMLESSFARSRSSHNSSLRVGEHCSAPWQVQLAHPQRTCCQTIFRSFPFPFPFCLALLDLTVWGARTLFASRGKCWSRFAPQSRSRTPCACWAIESRFNSSRTKRIGLAVDIIYKTTKTAMGRDNGAVSPR
jgi:hypothetical protein